MGQIAKVLVLGPPEGPQSKFVSTISHVKVRSSARTPTGNGFVPMSFGRVRVDDDLDLHLFGADRDQAPVVLQAISPGLIGAILLVGEMDGQDPHYAAEALDELSQRGVPTVVATVDDSSDGAAISEALNLPPGAIGSYTTLDKEEIKSAIISVLEAAVDNSEGSAAGVS